MTSKPLAVLGVALVVSACGPELGPSMGPGATPGTAALAGAWTSDTRVRANTSSGPVDKIVASTFMLLPTPDGKVAWRVGGCSVALEVTGETASLRAPAPECVLTDPTDSPFEQMFTLGVPGDVLLVSEATFEVVRTSKPAQLNYVFRPGEEGLRIALSLRVRPKAAAPDSTEGLQVSFTPSTGYAHRAR